MTPTPDQQHAEQTPRQAQQQATSTEESSWGEAVAEVAEFALDVALSTVRNTGEAACTVGSAAVDGACAVGSATVEVGGAVLGAIAEGISL